MKVNIDLPKHHADAVTGWGGLNELTKRGKPLVNTSIQRRLFKDFYSVQLYKQCTFTVTRLKYK